MLIASFTQFTAANVNLNPKELPDGIGVDARNLDVSRGDFRGMLGASLAHTLTGLGSQQASIYREGRDAPSDTAYWLTSALVMDYARSMLASDPTERVYVTDGVKPKYTDNTYLGAPPYPTAYVDLGVPYPTAGFAVALGTAGGGSNEDRVYLDTFVRANGDESAPNPITATITVTSGSTVNISSLSAVPSGAHGITLRRIYVSTGGDFQRVVEQAVAATTATDSLVRGAVLQTGGSTSKPAWLTPPDTMTGLLELWSGMHGAHFGKSYMACVPFKPHAWPLEYQKAITDTIVGSAKWGQTWLLATSGYPRVVTGTTPAGLNDQFVYLKAACRSKRSVRSVGHGVCWACNDGLAYHGQRGTWIITAPFISKTAWRALDPTSIIGACWGDWYIGFYNDGTRRGFMVNTINPTGVIWIDQGAYATFEDTISETLFLLDAGNTIKKWDYGTALTATFKSKVVRNPIAACPGAARIVATTYPVTFSMWADGVLKVNAQSVTSDEPFRLPSNYMAEEFQVQVSGVGPVEAVLIADEMSALP